MAGVLSPTSPPFRIEETTHTPITRIKGLTTTYSPDELAIGPTRYRFATWFSLELKSRISYNLEWDKVLEAMKDQLWLSAKETWNIPNDNAKSTQLRIANDLFRKFKNNLVTNYEEDMAELIKEYPDLEGLQCVRLVKHVLGRLVPNKETGKNELTEAHLTLNVLASIPTLQQDSRTSQQPQSICASGGPFDEIKEIEACELVIEWFGSEKIVAKGQVYPGRGGILHGLPIEPGFVKVQVDSVEEGCSAFPVARPTDEVKTLHDALGGQFIQWLRKYIRVSKKISSQKSMSQLASNGLSRYQTACARVRHTPVNTQSLYSIYTCGLRRAMAKLPNRPQKIQALANRFINRKDRNKQIHVASPDGMYGKTFYESVEYESLLGWMTNDWIDVTILHWWCMHLFEMVSKEEFNTCGFFNPTIIQGHVCDQESNFAIKHILSTVEAHKEKEIFLALYLQDSHWVLFLICPKTRTGYIFDSYNRDKKKTSNGFYMSNTLERAFDNSFKWTMLELHDSTRALRKDELDGWTINAGSKFFQDYCNDD
nr:ulp1 protease family, C-terminal catalytic domain-containing protein [Tanacetum cinerariifolium]